MAKLLVTIDYIDGRTKVVGPIYPDEIDTRGMLFRLSERGIAGVTITNAEPLTHLMQEREMADEASEPVAAEPAASAAR